RALLDLEAVEVGRDGARELVHEVGVPRVLLDVQLLLLGRLDLLELLLALLDRVDVDEDVEERRLHAVVLADRAPQHAVDDDALAGADEAAEVVLREELEALRLLAALHRLGRLLDLELLRVHEEGRRALARAHDELERGVAAAAALVL